MWPGLKKKTCPDRTRLSNIHKEIVIITGNCNLHTINVPFMLLHCKLSLGLPEYMMAKGKYFSWSWICDGGKRGGCVPAGRRLGVSFPTGRGVWGWRRRPGLNREPDRDCSHLQKKKKKTSSDKHELLKNIIQYSEEVLLVHLVCSPLGDMEVLERFRCFRPIGSLAIWALRADAPAGKQTHTQVWTTLLSWESPTWPPEGTWLNLRASVRVNSDRICMRHKAKFKFMNKYDVTEKPYDSLLMDMIFSFSEVDMIEKSNILYIVEDDQASIWSKQSTLKGHTEKCTRQTLSTQCVFVCLWVCFNLCPPVSCCSGWVCAVWRRGCVTERWPVSEQNH